MQTPDAEIDASPAIDAESTRVRDGLLALWSFDEAAGSLVATDTSGHADPVPLRVEIGGSSAAPTFSSGTLVASQPGRLLSVERSRLPADCIAAQAVTLEVWAAPASAIEGTPTEASFVAGLAANIQARDIAILHAGNHWVGRVRTTAAADGTPSLEADVPTSTAMTHVVVVADASTRALYVDGQLAASSAAGPLLGWDPTYPMMLVDEFQHARQWTGTLALVALYGRALTAPEVARNFAAGSAAP